MTPASTCCLPAPISLHRPWWRRVLERLRRPGPEARERELYRALAHLSDETLRDIGAPEWVHSHEREDALRRLDHLRW